MQKAASKTLFFSIKGSFFQIPYFPDQVAILCKTFWQRSFQGQG
jgi:hypothetical protein